MNDWLVFLAAVVCYLLLAFSVSWLIPTLWRAGKNVHIKHCWQGGEVKSTKYFQPGQDRPEEITYNQWFECVECGKKKIEIIGSSS